jgi:hypothetical protein
MKSNIYFINYNRVFHKYFIHFLKGNVNVKLSMCLINKEPCHEDIWGEKIQLHSSIPRHYADIICRLQALDYLLP